VIPLESLPDAVVVVDGRGCIRRVNPRAEQLFGYASEELVGQRVELLVPEAARERHAQHFLAFQRAPQVRPMGAGMLMARHKSGRELPVEIMLSPNRDGSVLAVVRDVTMRRELERFRDEYVGYVSHDLKNPLSVISLQARWLAQQLAGRSLRDEERAVEVIAESAAFIDRLVRELLEMCYLESDEVEVHPEPTELVPFLKAVLERTVSTSDRARIRLEIHDAAVARIDGNRIERVVVNFVQNAIKYSPHHTPIVVRLEAKGPMAVVSVIDAGAGLHPEEAAFVFDKYRRTDSAKKREGMGLGLYISRLIVEAHRGKVGVDSRLGAGSTFWFHVPLVPQEPRRVPYSITLEPAPAPVVREAIDGRRVLVVDDEANAVSALVALLGEEGLVVAGATSGKQALDLAAAAPPDAVVLDVEMPGMTGIELLARLRERQPELPAIIMSGYMEHHAGIAEARESAGAAYVGKPVDVDDLVEALRRVLASRPG